MKIFLVIIERKRVMLKSVRARPSASEEVVARPRNILARPSASEEYFCASEDLSCEFEPYSSES